VEEVALLHGREAAAFAGHVGEDDVRERADEERVLGDVARGLRALVQRGGEDAPVAAPERLRVVVVDQVEDELGVVERHAGDVVRGERGLDVRDELRERLRPRRVQDRIVGVHRRSLTTRRLAQGATSGVRALICLDASGPSTHCTNRRAASRWSPPKCPVSQSTVRHRRGRTTPAVARKLLHRHSPGEPQMPARTGFSTTYWTATTKCSWFLMRTELKRRSKACPSRPYRSLNHTA